MDHHHDVVPGTRLPHLSVPVMTRIARFCSVGSSVIALWLCGDQPLNHLLGTLGAVTELYLEDQCPWSTSRWPLIVGKLKGLTKLSIKRPDGPLGPSSLLVSQLSLLSQDLEYLHLDFHSTNELFTTPGGLYLRSSFPALRSLLLGGLQAQIGDFASDIPQNLTILSLSLNAKLDSALEHLPRSLTDLSLVTCSSNPPKGQISVSITTSPSFLPLNFIHLPLVSFRLETNKFSTNDASVLPPTLTSLSLSLLEYIDNAILQSFPPSLNQLKLKQPLEVMSFADFGHLYSLADFELHNLHPSHTPLSLDSSMWRLPDSLTRLVLGFAPQGRVVLPSRLRTLSVPLLEQSLNGDRLSLLFTTGDAHDGDASHHFPSSLIELSFSSVTVTPSFLSSLSAAIPQTIRSIRAGNDCELFCNKTLPLYPELSILELSLASCNGTINWTSFSHLTDLNIRTNIRWREQDFAPLLKLKSFHLYDITSRCHPRILESLPNSLTELVIQAEKMKTLGLELMKRHYRILQTFDSLLRFECPWYTHHFHMKDMLLLPRSLLSLKFSGKTSMNGMVFQFLPRGLKSLVWPWMRSRNLSYFHLLPRGIRTLEIASPSIEDDYDEYVAAKAPIPWTGRHRRDLANPDFYNEHPDRRVSNNSFMSHNNPALRKLSMTTFHFVAFLLVIGTAWLAFEHTDLPSWFIYPFLFLHGFKLFLSSIEIYIYPYVGALWGGMVLAAGLLLAMAAVGPFFYFSAPAVIVWLCWTLISVVEFFLSINVMF